jgi:hypothetical protein
MFVPFPVLYEGVIYECTEITDEASLYCAASCYGSGDELWLLEPLGHHVRAKECKRVQGTKMKLPNLEKIQFGEPNNKRLVCADGFWLSVQGDDDAYSEPRGKHFNVYAYRSMEIMASQLLPLKFSKYLDSEKNRIYGYVPVEMIEVLLASHGGVV